MLVKLTFASVLANNESTFADVKPVRPPTPKTRVPAAATVVVPLAGIEATVWKSNVPSVTVVPDVYVFVPLRIIVPPTPF